MLHELFFISMRGFRAFHFEENPGDRGRAVLRDRTIVARQIQKRRFAGELRLLFGKFLFRVGKFSGLCIQLLLGFGQLGTLSINLRLLGAELFTHRF